MADAVFLNEVTVERCFCECLYEHFPGRGGAAEVYGKYHRVTFNTVALTGRMKDIRFLLGQLPVHFLKKEAISLTEACIHGRTGVRWTGDPGMAEKLMLLGMGVGMVRRPEGAIFWPTDLRAEPEYVLEWHIKFT